HVGALHRLMQSPRHLHRPALVPEVPLDLAHDGGRGKCRELQAPLRLEALDGLQQSDIADLDDVLERLAPVAEFFGQKDHQIVEQLDKLLADLWILRLLIFEEEPANKLTVRSDGRSEEHTSELQSRV